MKRVSLSLRARLSLISMGALAVCCFALTMAVNFSAARMTESFAALDIAQPAGSLEILPMEPARQTQPAMLAQAAQTDFRKESLLYMALIVVGGGALTYFLTGKALRPLRRLADTMEQCTVQDLARQLPVPACQDEVAQLTRAFNQMSSTLAAAFANQQRFAQNAAHELRTPLAVMQTRIEVFGMKAQRTPQEYRQLLDTIAANTKRLSLTVQDLLQLADLQAPAAREPVPMAALARDVAAQLAQPAAAAGVQVACTGQECTVQGSRRLLERAVYNLVENAIRYGRPGTQVQLRVSAQPGQCILEVEDDGPGIPQEAQQRIFEPFYRVDRSRSRQLGGAGLGLALVQQIAQLHGGSVSVRSQPGEGSTFSITLPLQP